MGVDRQFDVGPVAWRAWVLVVGVEERAHFDECVGVAARVGTGIAGAVPGGGDPDRGLEHCRTSTVEHEVADETVGGVCAVRSWRSGSTGSASSTIASARWRHTRAAVSVSATDNGATMVTRSPCWVCITGATAVGHDCCNAVTCPVDNTPALAASPMAVNVFKNRPECTSALAARLLIRQ